MKDSRKRIKKRPKNFKKKIVKIDEQPKKNKASGFGLNIPARRVLQVFIYILPLVIFVVFLVVYYLNTVASKEVERLKLRDLNYSFNLSSFPVVERFTVPDITAEAAIVTDVDSQTVLYSKNSDLRFSMASTAKIMTALVGLDYYQQDSVLTIYTPVVEGSRMGFVSGDRFYFHDLLYALLLPSSNEAAYAIAQNYPGGYDEFVIKMNQKALELGLLNTHFSDPAGLDDDNNYSTVLDLSRLAGRAMKSSVLAKIFATKQKNIYETGGRRGFEFSNLNKLLGIDGVNGIKTGTTEGAGEVLVTSKSAGGHNFVVIVMRSKQRFVDTQRLLSLTNNLRYIKPHFQETARSGY